MRAGPLFLLLAVHCFGGQSARQTQARPGVLGPIAAPAAAPQLSLPPAPASLTGLSTQLPNPGVQTAETAASRYEPQGSDPQRAYLVPAAQAAHAQPALT